MDEKQMSVLNLFCLLSKRYVDVTEHLRLGKMFTEIRAVYQ